ncbi:hypothetical protein DMENIID0001_088190 [Sergentomyia squamirostris]
MEHTPDDLLAGFPLNLQDMLMEEEGGSGGVARKTTHSPKKNPVWIRECAADDSKNAGNYCQLHGIINSKLIKFSSPHLLLHHLEVRDGK